MERRPTMTGLSAALLMACMLLPLDAHGSGWAIGMGGGYADKFHYRTYTSVFGNKSEEVRINATGFPLLSVLSNAGGRVGMTAQAAFLPYGDRFTRTDQVPVSVGVRYRVTPEPRYDASPYIEVSPALVWSNWRGSDYYEGGGESVKPGLVAGLGVQGKAIGKIGVDFGARYFLSADAKVISRTGSPRPTQTLEGLKQLGFIFGVYYRL